MIQWRPFAPWLTAALALGAGFYYTQTTDAKLAEARGATNAAIVAYAEAKTEALAYEMAALDATHRADSLEHARALAKPAVAKIVAAAPDTCKPVIAALQGQLAQAEAEPQTRKDAFTEQKQATAVLAPAGQHVADAAHELVKASKPSFFKRLIPEVGVGGAAGISVVDRRPDAVVGVTLSWRLH